MEEKIFDFDDYREILNFLVTQEKNKKTSLVTVAKSCKISSSTLSLVLQDKRELTLDQGALIGIYFQLDKNEQDYFINLIGKSRAGNIPLREYYKNRLIQIKQSVLEVKNTALDAEILDENLAQTLYSHWSFSAIRMLYASKDSFTAEELAERLFMSKARVEHHIKVLLNAKLLKMTKNGYHISTKRTLIPKESYHIVNHHRNWRNRSVNKIEKIESQDLFLTCPMCLSEEDTIKIKQKLQETFNEVVNSIVTNKPEAVRCLNIDFFEF